MNHLFHEENRTELYQKMCPGAMLVLFSGNAPRKTGDENYPYFTNRNFLYLTGIDQENSVFVAVPEKDLKNESLYVLPADLMAERWTGRRIKPSEAQECSGIENILDTSTFLPTLERQLKRGLITEVYLDLFKYTAQEPDDQPYRLAAYLKKQYPYVTIKNVHPLIAALRSIKKPCEIDAMRKAERITGAGIIAMMKASRPGMYEYEYKAEFNYALAKHGVLSPGFPSIISVGQNNFCIHYYDHNGQAQDGDMVLNDVGACWDHEVNDVSRAWPCNGKFSEKQALLYQCAYNTSEYMFGIIRPGMLMSDVDLFIRKYNFEQLKSIGLCEHYEDVGKYIWHGGAHHVGFDVHDDVSVTAQDVISPGMVFCVDVGIYCEEWGIGFRLEDNCLVTPAGCENLSAAIPRSIEDIETIMNQR